MRLKPLILSLISSLVFIACADDQDDKTHSTGGETVNPGENGSEEGTEPEDPKKEDDTPDTPPAPIITPKEHTTETAVQYNEARMLPIRFILKLKQSLDVDIDRSSLAKAVKFDKAVTEKIAELQNQWFGKSRNGLIDAETYLKIESELFGEKDINVLIGSYTTPDALILQGYNNDGDVDQTIYQRCQKIVEDFGGYFDTKPGIRNMIAIRGAVMDNDQIRRTHTADLYKQNLSKTDPETGSLIHFASGAEINPDSGQNPYDDIMLTVWQDTLDNTVKYYVHAYPMSTDPGMQGGNTNGYKFDGSAHLMDGQYIGKIGKHSTSHFNHAISVLNACYQDTDVFELLKPGIRNSSGQYALVSWDDLANWVNKTELPRINYNAVNNIYAGTSYNGDKITASGTTEVIRDFRLNNNSSDGILSLQEMTLAKKVLANLYPADAVLTSEYANASLNTALDMWFKDYFARYTDEECQLLFGMSAEKIYKEDSASLRAGIFKNAYTRYRDTAYDIAINIHTAPDYETSSQGCLNIPISSYPAFYSTLNGANAQTNYLYTLIDSSKIADMTE